MQVSALMQRQAILEELTGTYITAPNSCKALAVCQCCSKCFTCMCHLTLTTALWGVSRHCQLHFAHQEDNVWSALNLSNFQLIRD